MANENEEEHVEEMSPEDMMGSVMASLDMDVNEEEQPAEESEETEDTDDEVEETEDSEEESDDESEESEESEETDDKEEEEDHKDLTPEAKAIIQKRIDKEVGKRKALEEQLSDKDSEIESLKTDLEEAQEATPAPVPADVHPLMLVTSKRELDKAVAQIDRTIEWLEDHVDDGYEPEDPEQPSYEAKDIRRRLRQVERERSRIVPQAEKALEQRMSAKTEALKMYPELGKTGSSMEREARKLLREFPGLKQVPNHMLMIGDMLTNQAARKSKTPAPKGKKKAPKLPTKTGGKGGTRSAPQKRNSEKTLISDVAAHLPT